MKKARILAVDDSEKFTRIVKYFLEGTDSFEVCEVNCACDACAAALKFHPDLILLDLDLGGADGGDVAMAMRREPQLRQVPIVFLSGLLTADAGVKPDEVCGGIRYFAKPLNPLLLARKVSRVLAEEKGSAAA